MSHSCVQVLSLHGCVKVSDEAVAAVALHGSLHSLTVNSIPGIGLSTIKALATATRYSFWCMLWVHCRAVEIFINSFEFKAVLRSLLLVFAS